MLQSKTITGLPCEKARIASSTASVMCLGGVSHRGYFRLNDLSAAEGSHVDNTRSAYGWSI